MVRIHMMALAAVLTTSPVLAQSSPGTEAPARSQDSAQDVSAIRARAAEYLARCLQDWDTATHMTQKEWNVTCRRVAAEREKFLMENPLVVPSALPRR
jgi:hypothetical protein